MKAKRGDWLVEPSGRRGQVTAVKHQEGRPPYLVRWLDTEHEALVFPGPDTHVVTAEEEAARLRAG
ncbi:DUF1918 domain-containing protein [Lentzea sp. NBC_00516]|jgi:hypothetical protein|uniref:DUF1918 domain-containing protein n=1 Tax=Lentzea sp. NBC_00516 TaxID=2903582 RepID=UPI002E815662|nr:DUF1918 domain-containing protein [Lentzea sp. NBC_00516]WUD27743.1 DUF1918 domain-containing protein [Lentzea sp. NBC_00516]